MHRSPPKALAAWLALALALIAQAQAAPPAVESARNSLQRNDPRAAVAALEAALPGASDADRRPILDALRDAYPRAAEQAQAEGKSAEADTYRDNLEILTPPSRARAPVARPLPQPAPEPAPAPAPVEPSRLLPTTPEPATKPPHDFDTEPAAALPIPRPLAEPPAVSAPKLVPAAPAPTAEPTPALPILPETSAPRPPAQSGPTLREADEAFNAERYEQAGVIYAGLARAKTLPKNRRDHWAYCRAVEVVRKLNARPASTQEWAAIHSEIRQIRELSPDNWFAEYLSNLASERNSNPRLNAQRSNKRVLRGSSPDESPARTAPAPAPAPAPAQHQAPAPSTQVNWSRQPIFSTNFIVVHVDADRALAQQAAQAAELARESEMKRWGASNPSAVWSPRCEIVIFPTARDFNRETLQPADSPGFSTMGMNAGRIVLRRVHLRADHPKLVKAILPHEVTHVVLADLFPTKQIPRWADEGMAVLAEPHAEQALRANDLDDPLKTGRLFRLTDLTAMDYPEPKHWALYYAQSVSLTRFLVETGSPAQFVKLVRTAQETGLEPALKAVYDIDGPDDLQARWLAYARDRARDGRAAAVTASSGDTADAPAATKR